MRLILDDGTSIPITKNAPHYNVSTYPNMGLDDLLYEYREHIWSPYRACDGPWNDALKACEKYIRRAAILEALRSVLKEEHDE